PVSKLAVSVTRSVQVPAAIWPLSADRAASGRNEPVKGAVPALMAVAAASSNTVFGKLSPPAPRLSDNRMVVLAGGGPMRRSSRSPSYEWVRVVIVTLRSTIGLLSGTTTVALTAALSGMTTGGPL